VAAVVESAVQLLGSPYPRNRVERQERLAKVSKEVLDALDERFFSLIEAEADGFERAADRFVERFGSKQLE
jgi:hypothetical protein